MIRVGKPERTRSSYCIEIEPEHFLAVTRAEDDYSIPYEKSISARLEGTSPTYDSREVEGVHSVEYNGHFGSAIYYTVDAEDDTEELHAKVAAIVTSQIKAALKLQKRKPRVGAQP